MLARALDGFRLIDQGAFEVSAGLGEWLVGYYLARGRDPVTLHTWQFAAGEQSVRVVATVPCADYDDVADELDFAVRTMKVAHG